LAETFACYFRHAICVFLNEHFYPGMTISFNADEVLRMAEHIERNGAAFYLLAAESLPKFGGVFRELAGQEEKHLALFVKMRGELSASERETTVYDPDNQNFSYLQAMADGAVFNAGKDQSKYFASDVSLAGILDVALGKEKDSIVFYVGLKALVPEHLGGEKLDHIIREEFRHISALRGMLEMK